MVRARQQENTVWSSIAILGTIGWSVVVPTLVGIAVGVWLDNRSPGRISWALTLMLAGLVLGSLNAWLRIRRDQQ